MSEHARRPEPSRPTDLDALLRHAGWVRRLARALVTDEHEADEVVQQTWHDALRWPPREGGDLRGWLATVVRRVARQRRRLEDRERRRMAAGARADVDGGGLDAVERLELQRSVATAVLALADADRQVLVLRYYDELTPTRIARELDLPLPTVKSRLARAKDRLRERLSATDASGWHAGMALLAFGTTASGAAAGGLTTGVTMASTKLVGAAIAVAAVVITGAVMWDGDAPHRAPRAAVAGAAPITEVAESAGRDGTPGAGPEPWRDDRGAGAGDVPPAEDEPAPPQDGPAKTARIGHTVAAGGAPAIDSAPPPTEPAEPPVEDTAPIPDPLPASAATLVVQLWLSGTPAPVEVDLSSDPFCAGATGAGGQPLDHARVRTGAPIPGAAGAPRLAPLADVFVTIDGVSDEHDRALEEAVVLDQIGCTYEPRVFGVMKKQDIEIVNSDDTLHNIHAVPRDNKEFNVGMPNKGMKVTKEFKKAEDAILITCDVHPWMAASCYVMDHPWFGASGFDGRASIDLEGLPDGNYTLRAEHPFLGVSKSTAVFVREGVPQPPTFTFTFVAD